MREISVYCAGEEYQTRSFVFFGGEIQVQVPGLPPTLDGDLTVMARLQSAESLIQLCLLTEILDRVHDGKRTLVVPYFPYARQDRVMAAHEAFSLKPVARLVNSLGFDRVVVCDPHSDVTAALVEGIRVIPQVDLMASHELLRAVVSGSDGMALVAPDAGAAKKALAVAQRLGLPLITASKVRDVSTGAITRTDVNEGGFLVCPDRLIVDDICDGGRTFIELARVLRAQGARRVYLYVTHGIFSQGLGVFEGLIDSVFTTDSFLSRDVESPYQSPVPLHVSSVDSLVCP